MIIFNLDGTLADCEHRRHWVDPSNDREPLAFVDGKWWHVDENHQPCKKWHPRWDKFEQACDCDTPIVPTIQIMTELLRSGRKIQVWSGRSESVREKTEQWLVKYTILSSKYYYELKMRPIGDSTPDDVLKESWLNEHCADLIEYHFKGLPYPVKHDIDFVFDDHPKVVRMWHRRGIFVFDCNQKGEEF